MKNKILKNQKQSSIFYFLASGLFLFSIFYFLASGASAQIAPEFMVTWKAGNYAPADYPGKILPIAGTKIHLAFEIIDGGKIADISRSDVRWLINGKDQRIGRGLKTVSFEADGFKGDQIVDITLPEYRGQTLEHQLVIPLASPEVGIFGGPTNFQVLTYFFNITQPIGARYSWTANGASFVGTGNNPDIINLDLEKVSKGDVVNLSVMVQNLLKPLEIASRSIQFIKP